MLRWAQQFLGLLRTTLVIAEHRSVQSIKALSQDSVSDLIPSDISIYETALCAAAISLIMVAPTRNTCRTSTQVPHKDLKDVIAPLAFILERVVCHVTFQIARIAPLQPKRHIFMTVQAIQQIAERLELLASSGYFTSPSPSPAQEHRANRPLSVGNAANVSLDPEKLSPIVSRTDRRSQDKRRRSGIIEPLPELQQVKTEVVNLTLVLGRICSAAGHKDLERTRKSLESVRSSINSSI